MKISQRLVFMDVETTGFNPSRDRIIEIFLLAIEGNGEIEEYETFINPERPIPAQITKLTGITDGDVKDFPTEKDVAGQIREFIGHGTPVAHNLPFDRRFLNAMFKRNNLLEIGAAGLDTLVISRELFPRLCIYPNGGGSHRLSNLMYHFGLEINYANTHRAKDDVLLLVEVFRNLQAHANGKKTVNYPEALIYGCPTCGTAMYLEISGDQKILVCRTEPTCAKLVV